MKHRRILSGLAALMLAASLPMSALAREWDIADGDIIIVAGDDGQKVSQGTENDVSDDNPIIIGNSATNTVSIVAEKDKTANVTLGGVDIDVSDKGKAAVSTSGEGDVTIELDGTNEIKSGSSHAGLKKRNEGNLEITDKDSNGALIAKGGDYGAGIGGSGYQQGDVSNITISGGNIKATGGVYGAGIGGGYLGSGSDITISGGEVVAEGGNSGSGIGGGYDGNGTDITISGGNVVANGGWNGSGIGGGAWGSGSDITVSGGKVKATSDGDGAGIGGGFVGSGSDITISGGSVTAIGGSTGAGIGGGAQENGSNITISGGNVTAQGGTAAAGIGGGYIGTGSNITISGDAQTKVQGGAGEGSWGAGVGIGDGSSHNGNGTPQDGTEVPPDTSKLTANGKIEYYAPGADMSKDAPSQTIVGTYIPPQPAQEAEAPAQIGAPLFRVTDGDGKDVSYETAWRDGVLTVTVEADRAVLTGRLSGIASLQAQGIERIVFITKGATSEFLTADLLAAAPATERYTLTHDGEAVTFTAGEADVSEILVKA